jgi:hypothetical protein
VATTGSDAHLCAGLRTKKRDIDRCVEVFSGLIDG